MNLYSGWKKLIEPDTYYSALSTRVILYAICRGNKFEDKVNLVVRGGNEYITFTHFPSMYRDGYPYPFNRGRILAYLISKIAKEQSAFLYSYHKCKSGMIVLLWVFKADYRHFKNVDPYWDSYSVCEERILLIPKR